MTRGFFMLFGGKYLIRYLLTFSLGLTGTMSAQKKDLNSADQYKTDGIVQCQFRTWQQNDSLVIFARLSFKTPPADSLLIESIMFDASDHEEVHNLSLHHAIMQEGGDSFVYKWAYAMDDHPSKIVLKVQTQPRAWQFTERINLDQNHPHGGLTVLQANHPYPIFNSYVEVNDSIMLQTNSVRDTVYAYYYSHPFDPARPPMTLRPTGTGSSLRIDSVFTWNTTNTITPSYPGLYFVQVDTTSIEGIALFVGPTHYPKPQQIVELTAPLLYITTKDEYQDINADPTSKKALDKFWLSTVGSPQKARRSIRQYYQLVESSNKLFTSYKEGWKTDRGMIYTIMGPPLVVSKRKNQELWEYRKLGDFQVIFTFNKVSNIFSDNHYELVRKESHDRFWFVAIDRWRKGLIGF